MSKAHEIASKRTANEQLAEGLSLLKNALDEVISVTTEEEKEEPCIKRYTEARTLTTGLQRRFNSSPQGIKPSTYRKEHCYDMLASMFDSPKDIAPFQSLAAIAKELLPEKKGLPKQILESFQTPQAPTQSR